MNGRQASGFTLIELLVTLTLMALLLTLVSPMTSKSLEKMSISSEIVDFKLRLRRASALALMNSCPITLTFRGEVLQGESPCVYIPPIAYEHLSSTELTIIFNYVGIPDRREIVLQRGTKPTPIDLYDVLGLADG